MSRRVRRLFLRDVAALCPLPAGDSSLPSQLSSAGIHPGRPLTAPRDDFRLVTQSRENVKVALAFYRHSSQKAALLVAPKA